MNELLSIPLANGSVTQASKLRTYFDKVIQAEETGEDFPVKLAHVWPIGYSRKDTAVRALITKFVQGIDYQSVRILVEREIGAVTEEVFTLTVSCAEYFAVRANREVFEVYRDCRKAIKRLLRGSQPDFSSPALAARAWADEYEAKQKALAEVAQAQQRLAEARPKVAFFDAVSEATNCIPMASAAAVLKLPGIGRNLLFRMLRADGILKRNNEPMQAQINAGHFQVEPKTYDAGVDGAKGKRLATVTRVTPLGL